MKLSKLFPWMPPQFSACVLALLILMTVGIVAMAITNVVVTVTMSDEQYTNLLAIAAERGQTPEQFLRSTNMGMASEFNRENEVIRFRLLLQLWENATPAKRLAAIEALR